MQVVDHNLVAYTHIQNAQTAGPSKVICHSAKALAKLAPSVVTISRHTGNSALPMLHSSDSAHEEGSAKHTADVGLLPVRRRRHQVLMDALVGGERSDPASLFGSPRSSSQSPSPERGER